ncbi:MAG: prenyltransferase [Pseudomonadota bacterium]
MNKMLGKIGLAFELARWKYFPVGVLPVFLGTALAWNSFVEIVWWRFVVCLLGMFFAHLGANTANDYFDLKSGVDKFAYQNIPETRGSGLAGSDVLTRGLLTLQEARFVMAFFFSIALVCGLLLFWTSGWFVLTLAVVGFVIGMFYCAPPVAFGYKGFFLGELGIFLAFGPLPVIGSYYVQTGTWSWAVVLASLPLALLTTSVVFNQHFAHAEADRQGGKRTPVVLWGEKNMRLVTKLLLVGVYVSVILNVVLEIYPILALAALLIAPIILIPAFKLKSKSDLQTAHGFLFKVVRANLLTSIILVASLLA